MNFRLSLYQSSLAFFAYMLQAFPVIPVTRHLYHLLLAQIPDNHRTVSSTISKINICKNSSKKKNKENKCVMQICKTFTEISRISSLSCFLKHSKSSLELNERQCNLRSRIHVALMAVSRTTPGDKAVPLSKAIL